MRSLAPAAIVVLAIGISSDIFADPGSVSGGGGTSTQPVVSGLPNGVGTAPGAASAATPNENNTDASDDTLYHGSTNETGNPMLRDEGPRHFKTHPKEKIQEVDSLKNLQSKSSDTKFQGSLLHSSVTSIDDIAAKATQDRDEASNVDSRFKAKQFTFAPQKNDEPVKAKSDSGVSPTPSPTPSPAAKNSSDQKK